MPVDGLEHEPVLLPAVGALSVRVDGLVLAVVAEEVEIQRMALVELDRRAQFHAVAVHIGMCVAQELLVREFVLAFLGRGIVGAGIIGIASFLLGIISDPLIAIKISVISGTLGCFIDSILGAILERRNYINNEHVNLLATICGAIIGIVSVM